MLLEVQPFLDNTIFQRIMDLVESINSLLLDFQNNVKYRIKESSNTYATIKDLSYTATEKSIKHIVKDWNDLSSDIGNSLKNKIYRKNR